LRKQVGYCDGYYIITSEKYKNCLYIKL